MMEQKYEDIVKQIGTVILGKEKQIRLALTCLFAEGHLLIEDMPGIGKTTLAQGIIRMSWAQFSKNTMHQRYAAGRYSGCFGI